MASNKSFIDIPLLYSKLKLKNLLSERALSEKHPEAAKFLKEKGLLGPG